MNNIINTTDLRKALQEFKVRYPILKQSVYS